MHQRHVEEGRLVAATGIHREEVAVGAIVAVACHAVAGPVEEDAIVGANALRELAGEQRRQACLRRLFVEELDDLVAV